MNAKEAEKQTIIAINNIDISKHIEIIDKKINEMSKQGHRDAFVKIKTDLMVMNKLIKHYTNNGFYVNSDINGGMINFGFFWKESKKKQLNLKNLII